ncbi:Kynurenine 3-monooxygenase [Yarrowia sp. C11]|nr:Kynurenine 3-monooxygenase [Yarrowia sp. E02]KAG5369516.1 Kynurenine 3-monooxygenase [Yarrowia sp. C11]
MHEVTVVGAGLVGCLAALAFADRGHKVALYDSRPDLRSEAELKNASLRSINLAVSARGIDALRSVDTKMADRVLADIIPMYGRMIHDLQGAQHAQAYGLWGECINSIDRAQLNRTMLDVIEDNELISFFPQHKLTNISLSRKDKAYKKPTATFETKDGEERVVSCDYIIGADGAFSKTRDRLQRYVRMNYAQQYIDCVYLELKIPKMDGKDTPFAISPNHLHIWPRHKHMLIALANGDGSFTSTLFAPPKLMEQICESKESFLTFFKDQFPDAYTLMGESQIVESYENNPRSPLVSLKCSPYNHKGECLLVGDAAHCMVPFYGQGMNAGFEDIRVLMEILDEKKWNVEEAFDTYTERRHKDLVAIVDLAMRNYVEMSHSVVSLPYLIRKKVDGVLGRLFPSVWVPLYSMVSFRADMPYSAALSKSVRQDRIIANIVNLTSIAGLVGVAAVVWYRGRGLLERLLR